MNKIKWIDKKQVPVSLERWKKDRLRKNCSFKGEKVQIWFERQEEEFNDKIERVKKKL